MDALIDKMAEAMSSYDDEWHKAIAHGVEDSGHGYDGMARAALDALTAAGYEVVKLPEPIERWDGEHLSWPVIQHRRGRENTHGEVSIRRSDGLIGATGVSNPNDLPEDARSFAAALLAAAKAAEAVGDE